MLGKSTECCCVVLKPLVNKPRISVSMVGKGRRKEEDGITWEIMHGCTLCDWLNIHVSMLKIRDKML